MDINKNIVLIEMNCAPEANSTNDCNYHFKNAETTCQDRFLTDALKVGRSGSRTGVLALVCNPKPG